MYSTGFEYQNNCQRCVVAGEAQWRGYDVEAMPYDSNDPVADDGFACWDFDAKNWRSDPGFVFFIQNSDIKDDTIKAFEKWGDDARAVIRIKWLNGTGHFIYVRKENGVILFEDLQIGSARDIDTTIAALSQDYYSHWLMRVDNREFSDKIKYAMKNRMKKK